MDQLFYVIYNSYYKHGNYKNDMPPLTVGGIFTIMWLTLALTIFTIFFNDTFSLPQDQRIIAAKELSIEENKPLFYLVLFASALLTYLLFYFNKRYEKIYLKYQDNVALNTTFAKYLAFSIAVVVILSPLFTVMLKNKIYTGRWY